MGSCSSLGFGDFTCSTTYPLGGIGFRGKSRIFFWILSLSVIYFPIGYCYSLGFGFFFVLPLVRHRWELTVLYYHKIMVIYHYPFFVVITQLFSWIILINDCICILTGSPG